MRLLRARAIRFSLRHEYIDPAEHRDYYISCYADTWRTSHGDLRGFVPETYYAAAVSHHADDHRAVSIIYNKDEPVGLIDMDTRRGAHAQYGWYSNLKQTQIIHSGKYYRIYKENNNQVRYEIYNPEGKIALSEKTDRPIEINTIGGDTN